MAQSAKFTSRYEVSGTFGAVATGHWIATQIGMAMLESGGNAFDAAVAVGFAMQVLEPQQNSLGGEVVILAHRPGSNGPRVICGQGVAPAAATIEKYKSVGMDLIPSTGLWSAVVPGAVDAWLLLFRDYGTRRLEDVLRPAIDYAHDGFPLNAEAVDLIEKSADRIRARWTTTAGIYLPNGEVPKPGDLFSNRVLAETYAKLRDAGTAAGHDRERQIEAAREAFYRGFVADRIGSFVANPIGLDGRAMGQSGLLTAEDVASWQATYEDPVCYKFGDLEVYKPGPWSQGPVFLQMLALIQNSNVLGLDPFSAEYVHTLVEFSKLAYADREAWYGDPNFIDVPLSTLLSDEYTNMRRALVTAEASAEFRPGQVPGRALRLPTYKKNVSGGFDNQLLVIDEAAERTPAETVPHEAAVTGERGVGDTTHIDVIDRHGNAVAATPSGGWLFGSPTIPELGFPLSTRAQMFWLQEGVSSALTPKARPRTTLSPTIALDGNGRTILMGSRGADYQDQWILQTLLRHVAFGFDLQSAIDAPMFQCDHWPRSDYPRDATPKKVSMDDRFAAPALDEMRQRGHDVRIPVGKRWGRVCAARKNGRILAAGASSMPPHFLALSR